PRQLLLGRLAEPHPRLHNRQQQRQVPKVDHVHVRIDLRSPVLQEPSDVTKIVQHCLLTSSQRPVCRRRQTRSHPPRVLVQGKHRKNVPKHHPCQNQRNPAQQKQPSRTHYREPGPLGLRNRHTHGGRSLASLPRNLVLPAFFA